MANNIGFGKIYDCTWWGVGVNNDISWGITYKDLAGPATSDDFIITVKTDNAGTSADNQFTIPTTGTGFLYDITTSDGYTATGVTGNHTITFPSAGEYEVKISGSFPYIKFAGGGDRLKLLEIKNWGIYGIGSSTQNEAFENCTNLTISATDGGEGFANVANFGFNIFTGAFIGCASMTNFPVINTSGGVDFRGSWYNSGITSFPTLDFSNAKSFQDAWRNCSSLVSFPLVNFSSVDGTGISAGFQNAWFDCSSLTTIPVGLFDGVLATNFSNTFGNTNLTTNSIDNVLVSIESNGTSNGTFTQSGGSAPSAVGLAAISSLISKGWTITYTT